MRIRSNLPRTSNIGGIVKEKQIKISVAIAMAPPTNMELALLMRKRKRPHLTSDVIAAHWI